MRTVTLVLGSELLRMLAQRWGVSGFAWSHDSVVVLVAFCVLLDLFKSRGV